MKRRYKVWNTASRGDFSVYLAIMYFSKEGYNILYPLDSGGHYDLVIERCGEFLKVQSKGTNFKHFKSYRVNISRGKRTSKYNRQRYKKGDFDILWVTTPRGCYCIPVNKIIKNGKIIKQLYINENMDEYFVDMIGGWGENG